MTRKVLNFIRGAGSVIDLMPAFRSTEMGQGIIGRSDADALRGDWERVGQAIREAAGNTGGDSGSTQQAESDAGGPGREPAVTPAGTTVAG